MTAASAEPPRFAAEPCAPLREAVAESCQAARQAQQAYTEAGQQVRLLRRDLVAAQEQLAETEAAADPRARLAAKSACRHAYQEALAVAASDEQRSAALADWAHELDRINRAGRLATRAAARMRGEVAELERSVILAERSEQASRVRAEAADAACLGARVRLAACEERQFGQVAAPGAGAAGPGQAAHPSSSPATGPSNTPMGRISPGPPAEPLVIEAMVTGDRPALELAAGTIAELGHLHQAAIQLQLQELVDAIGSAAADAGYLLFDGRHPFWSGLTPSEAGDVMRALTRLGFRLAPAEGWHAGRVPIPADLTVALAYAGLDPRNRRGLPDDAALRALPASIRVDGRAFLAERAPDLAMDQLVPLLETRAAVLGPLWDAWGVVRPVLLSPRRSLGSLPG
jgi:hypothetical protein